MGLDKTEHDELMAGAAEARTARAAIEAAGVALAALHRFRPRFAQDQDDPRGATYVVAPGGGSKTWIVDGDQWGALVHHYGPIELEHWSGWVLANIPTVGPPPRELPPLDPADHPDDPDIDPSP